MCHTGSVARKCHGVGVGLIRRNVNNRNIALILSIVVYITLAFVLAWLGWHASRRDEARLANGESALPFYCWELVASVAVVTAVFGLRMKTGTDYMMYLSQYFGVMKQGVFARPEGMEPGFELVTRAFAAMHCHFTLYFAFWAFVQASLMYYALRNYKFLLPWFALVLVLGPYFINWISFMRQWVVALGMLAMLPWIVERRFVRYCIGVLVLTMFHYSALLLLALYFVPFQRIARARRGLLLGIYATCFVLGLYPVWIKIFLPVVDALSAFGYTRYHDMLADVSNGNFHFLALGPLRLIAIFTPLVCLWYYRDVARCRPADRLLPLVFSLTMLGACYEVLFINTIHFMIRPVDLLYPCIVMMVAYVADCLYRSKRYVELAVVLAPVLSYLLLNVVKSNLYPSEIGEFINYHFVFI